MAEQEVQEAGMEMQAPAPGGGKKKMIIWILVAIVLLGIGVVVILLLTGGAKEDEADIQALLDDIPVVEEVVEEEEIGGVNVKGVPFIYSVVQDDSASVKSYFLNRETGESTLLELGVDNLVITAVPQIGFDGRIVFKSIGLDGPSFGYVPYVYDLKDLDSAAVPVPFADKLPFAPDAVVVSPDQTKVAVAFDNEALDPEGSPQKSVVIYNLLTGDLETVITVEPDEYLAASTGPNTFGGAGGFDISWRDLECVDVTVYIDSETSTDPDAKVRRSGAAERGCLTE